MTFSEKAEVEWGVAPGVTKEWLSLFPDKNREEDLRDLYYWDRGRRVTRIPEGFKRHYILDGDDNR